MNDTKQVIDSLDRVGQQLRQRESIVAGVMSELESATVQLKQRREFPLRIVATIATAVCMLVAIGVWLSGPRSLYAQTVAALNQVETVHVTGWTSRIIRKWPLEKPVEDDDSDMIPVEGWYWEDDGTPVSHEKFGPVVLLRRGNKLQEYQQDTDLLFVSDSRPRDAIERFSAMASYLEVLKEEGKKLTNLGTRREAGETWRGVKLDRGGSVEIWFDTKTDLPVRCSQRSTSYDGKEISVELQFRYNQELPDAVVSFKPPKTKHVRHGSGGSDRQLVWHRHVQDVAARIDQSPLDGPIAILPRTSERVFSFQYTKLTPDGKYWVLPLGHDQYFKLTVKNFINLRVQRAGSDRAPETWRVADDLLEVEFPRVDLVYKQDTPWQQWVQFALNQIGLEYVDVAEERTFWIARHDGRKLKPWRDVQPPVPYLVQGGQVKRGVVRPGIGHQLVPETIHGLFEDFNRIQNKDYQADHPIIVDQTGLPRAPVWDQAKHATYQEFKDAVNYDQYYVATDSPWFAREESRQMARDWYEKEFGITMTEEKRQLTIHVVRRKTQ